MSGKRRHARAIHEAGHAVVARKLGLSVNHVDARSGFPNVVHPSAGYAAEHLDVEAQIVEYEKDAIISLAGLAANRCEHPDFPHFDILTEQMEDIQNARNAIYITICLSSGEPPPREQMAFRPNELLQAKMYEIYFRLIRQTAALVDEHWFAIKRVARHLERHGRIVAQSELDQLIKSGERISGQH